jgi:hypothetical protein
MMRDMEKIRQRLIGEIAIRSGIGGRHFEDRNEAKHVDRRNPDYTGVAPYALNPKTLSDCGTFRKPSCRETESWAAAPGSI